MAAAVGRQTVQLTVLLGHVGLDRVLFLGAPCRRCCCPCPCLRLLNLRHFCVTRLSSICHVSQQTAHCLLFFLSCCWCSRCRRLPLLSLHLCLPLHLLLLLDSWRRGGSGCGGCCGSCCCFRNACCCRCLHFIQLSCHVSRHESRHPCRQDSRRANRSATLRNTRRVPLRPYAQGPQCAACRLPACTASSWRRLWRYTRRRWRISQPHRLWAWCRHTRRPWQQSHSTAGTEANFVSEETRGTTLRHAACQSGSQVRGAPRCSRQPQQPQQQPAGRLLLACAEVHVEVADGALCVILVSLLPPHCQLAATRAPQACRHRKWNRHIHTACGLVNIRHAFLT
jgi:hypothetical protein